MRLGLCLLASLEFFVCLCLGPGIREKLFRILFFVYNLLKINNFSLLLKHCTRGRSKVGSLRRYPK